MSTLSKDPSFPGCTLISLTKGMSALVDDDCLDLVLSVSRNWHAACRDAHYAVASRGGKRVRMHRMIAGATAERNVDHRHGVLAAPGVLDNRRANLRLCDPGSIGATQNAANRGATSVKTSSKHKGVFFRPRGIRHWLAKVEFQKRQITIGSFRTEVAAAQAYNRKALELFGEFARLNDVPAEPVPDTGPNKRHGQSSVYRGVQPSAPHGKKNGRWTSMVAVAGKKHYCGTYATEAEAALAYNAKARELLGDKAFQNVIEVEP